MWRDSDGLADHGRGACARGGGFPPRPETGRPSGRPARARGAKVLLRRAARAFGPKEAVARARCVVAEAEIALVSRDLSWPAKALDAARATLEEHGDRGNAAHARYLEVRRLLLIGRLD